MKRTTILLCATMALCACSKEKSTSPHTEKKSIVGKWYSINNPNDLIYDISRIDDHNYSVKTSTGIKTISVEGVVNDTIFTTIQGVPNKFYVDGEGTMINYLKKPISGYFISKYKRHEP